MRSSVLRILAAGMAAASLSAFALPTYAGTDEQTQQSAQGWCDVVPPFCGCSNNVTARCRPGPCQVRIAGPRTADDRGACPVRTKD